MPIHQSGLALGPRMRLSPDASPLALLAESLSPKRYSNKLLILFTVVSRSKVQISHFPFSPKKIKPFSTNYSLGTPSFHSNPRSPNCSPFTVTSRLIISSHSPLQESLTRCRFNWLWQGSRHPITAPKLRRPLRFSHHLSHTTSQRHFVFFFHRNNNTVGGALAGPMLMVTGQS
ncbi:hypothetical protein EI94DRAFT_754783 [Lactarius quietus]|nr:hypothetical protein EI94DRAFT_754783 [Lactarius quietus]